ncbi:pyridoxal-phosphate dependent enzyme [Numidum massiliense]|uniref:pyridoxal-phosphate dependent enzyme n=1 Tax=Numidum massiliense TaxID=1522315 RepID=UPI0006D555AA|nr:pyridoxal-phosphate dependent enzyme [Numidum massiliense]
MLVDVDVSLSDIRAAHERLQGVVHQTPVMTSRTLNEIVGCDVYLKCESLQRAGAFKLRGAYNLISQLPLDVRRRGVVAYSSGNHAQGVALAAKLLHVPAVIFMPQDAPKVKVAATEGYGAEVVFYDRQREDREALAAALAERRDMTLVPPYDHPHIIAGAGTAALELWEEVPQLDAVIAPIGGGGLISGTAIATHGVSKEATVFGAEPAMADDTVQSLAAGERVSIAPPNTVADGLRSPTPGAITFPFVQRYVARVFTVTEEQILDALRFALLRLKLVIEPSAAVPLAALLAGYVPSSLERVGVIVSGGNVEPELLKRLWD